MLLAQMGAFVSLRVAPLTATLLQPGCCPGLVNCFDNYGYPLAAADAGAAKAIALAFST